jgi:ATP-dependent phosphofructokinase / diphosphate-dependent phosphofructokinase
MASKLIGNAVVGQSGGPTAVINQSLVGVILEAQKAGHIEELLGAKHGVRGIVNDQYYKLKGAPKDLLERIALTPSSALGSSRDKPDAEYCKKILENFKKNNVRYFFYIGGNDSADTARIVNDMAKTEGYELRAYHVPKTIDNDLRVHDHTPGYGSAAKFVASAFIGDNYDNRSLPGIKINVVMGRHAGWLTAASVLARKYENDGPHLVYVPECPVTEEKLLADVDRVYSKLGRCIIAVSEGVSTTEKNAKGHYITWAEKLAQNLEHDSHGNVQLSGSGALGDALAQLITRKLNNPSGKKLRVRADTLGYLQRSFPGYVSKVDAAEAREVGKLAVKYSAKAGTEGSSIFMYRVPGSEYKINYDITPIANVARETKDLPQDWITDGCDINEKYLQYAQPIVGALPQVGTFDELK